MAHTSGPMPRSVDPGLSTFKRSPAFGPLGHETKDVLGGRLRRERLEPANRLGPDVGERMHTTDARPEDVAGTSKVLPAVQGRLDLSAHEEVGLLERVVVQADADAGEIFDEHHAVVNGAEGRIDQPPE